MNSRSCNWEGDNNCSGDFPCAIAALHGQTVIVSLEHTSKRYGLNNV